MIAIRPKCRARPSFEGTPGSGKARTRCRHGLSDHASVAAHCLAVNSDRTRAHHRLEIRRLKTAAFAHLDYPDARQALQVVRWRKDFTTGKPTIERVPPSTSLPPDAVTGAQPADWIRGHWKIENLLHHVRDRTFREDDSKIHACHLPRIMAGLRNLAIGVHRQDGHTNISAALRHTARDLRGPLAALDITG